MTKTFRFIGMALMTVLIGVSLAACSDDDDDIGDISNIYGTWEITHSKGWDSASDGSDKDTWDEDESDTRYVFEEDGDAKEYRYSAYTQSWRSNLSYNFTIKGNKLYFEEGNSTFTYTIKSGVMDISCAIIE